MSTLQVLRMEFGLDGPTDCVCTLDSAKSMLKYVFTVCFSWFFKSIAPTPFLGRI
jgi:hypothetical protein